MRRRCDDCGQFCRRLHPVYSGSHDPGVDREVCDDCAATRGLIIEEGQL